MKRVLILILFQLPVHLLNGQDEICNNTVDQRQLFEKALTGQPFQMKTTIGSQFFMGGAFTGDIILKSGDTIRNRQISYNGYRDELIWSKSGSTNMIKIDKDPVERFILHVNLNVPDAGFRHLNGTITGNKQIDLYAQILVEGTISLYATRNMHIIDKTEHEEYEYTSYIDRIEPSSPVYYINLPGDNLKVIKSITKKSLYSAFPEHKELIRTLMLEHHQAIRTEKDLISAIEILNKTDKMK